MAAAKKKPKQKVSTKSGAAGRASARPSAKKASAVASRAAAGPGQASEVEKRWSEYWECRTALESAVEAVREAQVRLHEAREEERERREVFDRTKEALRELLEVEPAGSGSDVAAPSAGTQRFGVVPGSRRVEDADEAREEDADEDSG